MDASKIVNSAVLGRDFETVIVNGTAYVINPPTIHKMACAGYYLSGLKEANTVMDIIRSMKDIKKASMALSCLISGNEDLSDELAKGTFDEVIEALSVGLSMLSAENFFKLSALAKNVANLTAKAKL